MEASLKIIKKMAEFLTFLSAIILALMLFMCNFDSIGRYFFNLPLPGNLEMNEALIVIVIFLPLAYCQMTKGHIHLSVVTERLSGGVQRVFSIISSVFVLVYLSLLMINTFKSALYSFNTSEISNGAVGFPIYPAKTAIFVGAALFLCYVVVNWISILANKRIEKQKTIEEQKMQNTTM